MAAFLLKLFDISVSACFIICAVLILRLILKKSPLYIRCLMWALVGLRLIMPFSIESGISLVPSSSPVSSYVEQKHEEITPPPSAEVLPDTKYEDIPLSPSVPDTPYEPLIPDTPQTEQKSARDWKEYAFYIWGIGAVAMLVYMAVSYLLLRIKVRNAVVYDEDIRIYSHSGTPFVLGVIRPRIYLPTGFKKEQLNCIISHERAHVKRLDHIFKPLAFLILAVHWFNPLVWVAYALYCKDTELACDEKVISAMDAKAKKLYSLTLLSCSAKRFGLKVPLAFGETAVKERVKKVMSYEKPSFWIITSAVLICIAVAVLFITNPKENGTSKPSADESTEQSAEQSAEESAEQSAEDSEDSAVSSEDESSEQSSADLSTDASVDISTDISVEPEPVVELPYQKSHETPEDISSQNIEFDKRYYLYKNVHPTYVKIRNISHIEADDTYLKIKGMKIWLCDKNGNKIDYVYTNSNGIARFEIDVKGDYYVCYDGNGTYSACPPTYAFSITTDTCYPVTIAEIPHKVLIVYDKTKYLPFTIKTYDAITKKPLGNVPIYTHQDKSKLFATTGSNGSVTVNPLVSYAKNGASSVAFRFYLEKEGYDGYQVMRVGPEENLLEVYLFPYMDQPYKITIINQKTREPLEGVVLKNSPSTDTSGPIINVSGSDGVVSGIKTDEQFKASPYVILNYDAVIENKYGDLVPRSAELCLTINKGQSEYIAYFIQTDTGIFELSTVDEPNGHINCP